MTYKKTFWMNVVFTALAILLAIAAFILHIGEHGFAHLPMFIFAYSCIIATPFVSALSFKWADCSKLKLLALFANYAAITLTLLKAVISIYKTPALLVNVEIIFMLIASSIILVPATINLKALRY